MRIGKELEWLIYPRTEIKKSFRLKRLRLNDRKRLIRQYLPAD